MGRSLAGERGLKQELRAPPLEGVPSLPRGGAWIETISASAARGPSWVAPSRGSVD